MFTKLIKTLAIGALAVSTFAIDNPAGAEEKACDREPYCQCILACMSWPGDKTYCYGACLRSSVPGLPGLASKRGSGASPAPARRETRLIDQLRHRN
ncbi:MAG: hypothetical protein KGM15_12015 [Pseudomonadota bacterium]|nr:hypothetical protein [Pseudomonadota bacterium]